MLVGKAMAVVPAMPECPTIAIIGEFSRANAGTQFPFGAEIRRGAELARKQPGSCLSFHYVDFGNSLANIPGAIKQEHANHGTTLFLGLGVSDQVLAALPALRSINGLLITPTATSDELTGPDSRAILMFPTNSKMAQKLAKETVRRKVKKVDVLYAANNRYSANMSQAFKQAFIEAGGVVSVEAPVRMGNISPDEILPRLRESQASHLFLPLFEVDVAKVVNLLHQAGIKRTYIGSDSWGVSLKVVRELTKEVPLEAWVPDVYSPDSDFPPNKRFVALYRAAYENAIPTDSSSFSFEGVLLYRKLLAACGVNDLLREPAACLRKVIPYEGISGRVTGSVGLALERPVGVRTILLTPEGA